MKTTMNNQIFKLKSKNFKCKDTYNHIDVYVLNDDVAMRVLRTWTMSNEESFTITVKQFTKTMPILMNDKNIMNELAETLRTTTDNVEWLLNEGIERFKSHKSWTDIDNIRLVNGLRTKRDEKQIMEKYKTV